MKRKLLILIILFIALPFIRIKAATYDSVNQSAKLLCEYVTNENNDSIRIYYKPGNQDNNPSFAIFYKTYDTTKNAFKNLNGDSGTGLSSFHGTFSGKTSVHYGTTKNYYKDSDASNFMCTQYAYIDTSAIDEVCFTNKDSCGGNFTKREKLYLSKNSAFAESQNQFLNLSNQSINNITIDNLRAHLNLNDINNIAKRETKQNMENAFPSSVLPNFLSNYIDGLKSSCSSLENKVNELQTTLDNAKNNGTITEVDYNTRNSNLATFKSSINSNCSSDFSFGLTPPVKNQTQNGNGKQNNQNGGTSQPTDDFSHNCKDFAKGIRMIGLLVLIAEIFIPFVIIIKAIISLVGTVLSANVGDLGKSIKKVFFSLFAGIAIFFIPIIVNGLFNIVGKNTETDDAGICRACIFRPFSEKCTENIEN